MRFALVPIESIRGDGRRSDETDVRISAIGRDGCWRLRLWCASRHRTDTPTRATTSDIQRLQDQVYETPPATSRVFAAATARLPMNFRAARRSARRGRVSESEDAKRGSVNPADTRTFARAFRTSARRRVGGSPGPEHGNSTWTTNSGIRTRVQSTVDGSPDARQRHGAEKFRPVRSSTCAGSGAELRHRAGRGSLATTVADLYQGNEVLIPTGSTLRGVISSVQKATRTQRKGSLTVAFDQITVNGPPTRSTARRAALRARAQEGKRDRRRFSRRRDSGASSAAEKARCSAC